jgi:hypothetical protein
MLSVTIKSFLLNAVMLNVVMLNVVMINVAMLNVIMLMVLAPATGLTRKYQTRQKILTKDIFYRIFVFFVNDN